MKYLRKLGQTAFAALLCVSVLAWSVLPASAHAPSTIQTLQGNAETIADHGHAHGLEEDLFQAFHGHSHDVDDHDHSTAVLGRGGAAVQVPQGSTDWRPSRSRGDPGPVFRLRRPPRG